MPKDVIERELPGAGALSPAQLQGVAQKSCSVLRNLGPQIQWIHSYVTPDKIYCIYEAPSEELIRDTRKRDQQTWIFTQHERAGHDQGRDESQ